MSAEQEAGAPDWRTACRALAQARAAVEETKLWGAAGLVEHSPFAHRWEHVQEVVRLARWLAAAEGATADEQLVIEAAAWLHDICKLQPHHAAAGAAATPAVLAATSFPPALVGAVVDAIAQHEGMTRPPGAPPLRPLAAAVLWDADKLSKLGVGALAMSMAAAWDAGKPLAERRARMELFTHTTLARTAESMNTPTARAEAHRRFAALTAALRAWEAEAALGAEQNAGQDAEPRE